MLKRWATGVHDIVVAWRSTFIDQQQPETPTDGSVSLASMDNVTMFVHWDAAKLHVGRRVRVDMAGRLVYAIPASRERFSMDRMTILDPDTGLRTHGHVKAPFVF